jgi:putative transposase
MGREIDADAGALLRSLIQLQLPPRRHVKGGTLQGYADRHRVCMRDIDLNPVRAHNTATHPYDHLSSSYRCNALGEQNSLLTPHAEYQRLGKTGEERPAAYRQLFRAQIADGTLDETRETANKAWVLGDDRLKRKLALQLDRRIAPTERGGDHEPDAYRNQTRINRV